MIETLCEIHGKYFTDSGYEEYQECPNCKLEFLNKKLEERDNDLIDSRNKCRKAEAMRDASNRENEFLAVENTRLKVKRFVRFNEEECWVYDEDGDNNLETLVCPVVISADLLHNMELLAKPLFGGNLIEYADKAIGKWLNVKVVELRKEYAKNVGSVEGRNMLVNKVFLEALATEFNNKEAAEFDNFEDEVEEKATTDKVCVHSPVGNEGDGSGYKGECGYMRNGVDIPQEGDACPKCKRQIYYIPF